MAKAGRKRTDTKTLEKRGSWRGKSRKKADAASERPAPRLKKVKPIKVKSWPALLKLLPGYDPYRDSEGYKFDRKKAEKAINWIQQNCTHVKGEKTGEPFMLERWQMALVGNMFGWVNKKTGLRRYRKAFLFIPRKNGKSAISAALLLYLLFQDGEPGAEIYGAASEYKQASLVFSHAWGMVNRNPKLKEGCHVFKGQSKAIEVGQPGDDTYGIYRVISSTADAAHGFSTHAAVVDELHTQPDSELVDALETSTGSRRQPLMIYITTADYEREGSVCNATEDYADNVCKGIIEDPTFLPAMFRAAEDDDWTKQSTWKKANPNLGISVSLDYLKRECTLAQEVPERENRFKRLHLNIRTEQDVRWLPVALWDANAWEVDESQLDGCRCFAGIDIAVRKDIAGYCLLFPPEDEDWPYEAIWRLYMPKENAIPKEKLDRVPYTTWARQGLLTLTPGNVIDYAYMRKDFIADMQRFDIVKAAFDRWNFEILRQEFIKSEGFPADFFVAFNQGFAGMSGPSEELVKLLKQERIAHNAHPVLRWMASNVTVEVNHDDKIRPSKKKSSQKIDGIVMLIMALGMALVEPTKKASVYEDEDHEIFVAIGA